MSQLPFPRAILGQHSATLGKTGAGKSSALRVSVEDLLTQKKRVVIVDPKGDWWGLKSDTSGKGPGFPVITFGDFKEPYGRGDVPINERSGTHVAELIASGNRPCVIGFRGWMPGHMMQFWIGQGTDPHRADGFLPTLFNKNEGELYVFVDEVQNFAAKGKILSPQAGLCVHWTNKAMSESRGMGMTFHIASQRSQKVHNDTLDCCETLIGMRTAHPAARKSIEDWVNSKGDPVLGKEVLGTLAELKRGEAWVWSPENEFGPKRVQFPMFQTFDSFAPPQLQKKVSQAGWSEIDLDQVREKLATVIAEQKANDPKELKAQIAQLRKELAAKPKPMTAPVGPEKPHKAELRRLKTAVGEAMKLIVKITARGFEGENVDRDQITAAIEKAAGEIVARSERAMEARQKEFAKLQTEATRTLERLKALMEGEELELGVEVTRREPLAVRSTVERKPHTPSLTPTSNGNGHASLPPGERAILIAVAQFGEAERDQLTVLTGYKRSSRDAYVARLAQKGYLDVSGRTLRPTQEGVNALGSDYEPLPTGSALWEFWQGRLPEGELRILSYLVGEGKPVERNDLDEPTGYKRSSRDAYISRLAARRLVETPSAGMVQAAGALFD